MLFTPGGINCVVCAGASVLVRPISTALAGRVTNGGNPVVLAAAAGYCHHAVWRVQLVRQLEHGLLTGAQRVLCSGGSWGFGGLPQ
jgi:hypothetical protein